MKWIFFCAMLCVASPAMAQVPVPVPDDGPTEDQSLECRSIELIITLLFQSIKRDQAELQRLHDEIMRIQEATEKMNEKIIAHIREHNTYPQPLYSIWEAEIEKRNDLLDEYDRLDQKVVDMIGLVRKQQWKYKQLGCK